MKIHAFFLMSVLAVTSCGSSDDGGSGGASSFATMGTCSGGSTTNTCKQSEVDAYGNCIIGKCDSQYTAAFGAGYKTGKLDGGSCGSYLGCATACKCGDNACLVKCPMPSSECQSALGAVTNCVTSAACAKPACLSPVTPDAGTTPTGGGCAGLNSCCASMPAGAMRMGCEMQAAAVKAGGDTACNSVLMIYKASGICR